MDADLPTDRQVNADDGRIYLRPSASISGSFVWEQPRRYAQLEDPMVLTVRVGSLFGYTYNML